MGISGFRSSFLCHGLRFRNDVKIHIQHAIYHFKHFLLDNQQAVSYKYSMEKKQVTFRLEPAVIKRLKFIALERDITVTELLLEAIQDLFKKYETKKQPRK